MTQEEIRLKESLEHKAHWRRWGPYISERQWGTVREDYSSNGEAWDYFPHSHARSRAYRWGEDGLLGICDNHQRLCFALALWNTNDPILKERLFGLSNKEGNHGEDVKEYYYYLDNTPTHSYMKALYRYPQREFPYDLLVEENRRRGRELPEFELIDTGVFDGRKHFEIYVEYAKASAEDILIRIEILNCGPECAPLHLLPTLWFRNTWSWFPDSPKPRISAVETIAGHSMMCADHEKLGTMWLATDPATECLFTENETNFERLYGIPNSSPYVKDAFHAYIIDGRMDSVNPNRFGTKAAFHYYKVFDPGETWTVRLRLGNRAFPDGSLGSEFHETLALRKLEGDDFYGALCPHAPDADMRDIQRQAFAGFLWSKQFYHYVVKDWLQGDPIGPTPPQNRTRNQGWEHVYTDDILSMPDKWEFPWFAAWDHAFHCIPLAMVDPEYAKRQLILLTREWYMHPNGQLPAYEWSFADANPPVQAWAAWRVFKIEKKMYGRADRLFLERVFQKLLLNFTWWVNRADRLGNNIFEGGFLGLDNIGVFDRSKELPGGGFIEQTDATSWMATYCLNLLRIAIELAQQNISYEDIASKFFEHFLRIAHAMHHLGGQEKSLWHDDDGFYYDVLRFPDGRTIPLRVRSAVGLIPLFAVETFDIPHLKKLPGFTRRMEWFLEHRPDLSCNVTVQGGGVGERMILSAVNPDQLRRILARMLSEDEFLSPYGIRSLSRYHKDHPFVLNLDGMYSVDYEPGESRTGLFGGNSNWRGPVWIPINYLLIEALQKFHHYFGPSFRVECPTGSGRMKTLWEVSQEISQRLIRAFEKDSRGRRRFYHGMERLENDPEWGQGLQFYEFFNAETGAGVGASHHTGWTGLIAKLIQQHCEYAQKKHTGSQD